MNVELVHEVIVQAQTRFQNPRVPPSERAQPPDGTLSALPLEYAIPLLMGLATVGIVVMIFWAALTGPSSRSDDDGETTDDTEEW